MKRGSRKERNDGWLAVLHFLAWIYGTGRIFVACMRVCTCGSVGTQHWKFFRNAELDRNRKSEEKKQEIEARGVSLSVPICGRGCIRLYVGRWVGDMDGLACRAGQGQRPAGQQGSTAEASCQRSQKIDAAALACRQVTGPPPLPSSTLPVVPSSPSSRTVTHGSLAEALPPATWAHSTPTRPTVSREPLNRWGRNRDQSPRGRRRASLKPPFPSLSHLPNPPLSFPFSLRVHVCTHLWKKKDKRERFIG